jgi:hypothetical protein
MNTPYEQSLIDTYGDGIPSKFQPGSTRQETRVTPPENRAEESSNDPAPYLDDDVTVGELVRWLNAEVVKAGRAKNTDRIQFLIKNADGVESTLKSYRLSNLLHQ